MPGVQRETGSRPDFFEPLDLGRQLADLGIELGEFLVVGLGLVLAGVGFGKQVNEVVDGLPFPAMQLTGMNLMFGRDLGDRFLLFEHLDHHLGFERGGMMFLFRHDVSSVTFGALQTCLVFGDHYN